MNSILLKAPYKNNQRLPKQTNEPKELAKLTMKLCEKTSRHLCNNKYGEFVITPALMMGMDDTIIDRIAFGGVKELEELYQQ